MQGELLSIFSGLHENMTDFQYGVSDPSVLYITTSSDKYVVYWPVIILHFTVNTRLFAKRYQQALLTS